MSEFDPICEVQSDKASVEITSPYEGVVKEIYGDVGQVVKVGKVLCDIEMEGEEGESAAEEKEDKAPEAGPSKSAKEDVPVKSEVEGREPVDEGKKMVHSTPAVRRIAKENGLDISVVAGTGKDGRVTKEDVLNHLSSDSSSLPSTSAPSSSRSATTASAETQQIPLSSIRKGMFRAMTASLQIPHFAYSEDIDTTELERLRTTINTEVPLRYRRALLPAEVEILEDRGEERVAEDERFDRVTSLSLFVKALGIALSEYPLFRSTLNSSPNELSFSQRSSCDVSIALSTSSGLFTPLIPNVESMNVFAVASWIAKLQLAARGTPKGQAPRFPGPSRSGTITLSNVGIIGGSASPLVFLSTGRYPMLMHWLRRQRIRIP